MAANPSDIRLYIDLIKKISFSPTQKIDEELENTITVLLTSIVTSVSGGTSGTYSFRGYYDATQGGEYTTEYPSSGGSGDSGAIKTGDNWLVLNDPEVGSAGVLGIYGNVLDNTLIIALKDNPDVLVDTDWYLMSGLYSSGPFEALSNKDPDPTFGSPNNDYYPTTQSTKTYVDAKTVPITGTRVEIVTLLNTSQLIKGKKYIVTDPLQGGTIVMEASAVDSFSPICTWIPPTLSKPYTIFRLSGSSGSVNDVTINSANVMTAVVNYTTSLSNTASLVAANIAANSATSGYTAFSIIDAVVVHRSNNVLFSGSVTVGVTTLVVNNLQASLQNGQDLPAALNLEVVYDISGNRIRSAYDPYRNNKVSISETYRATLSFDPILEFPWGVARNVTCSDSYVKNYLMGALTNVTLTNGASIENISGAAANTMSNISADGPNAKILNNYLLAASSSIANIITRSQVSGNQCYGTTNIIGNCVLLGSVSNCGIKDNLLNGASAAIRYIFQTEGATGNNGNILSLNTLSSTNSQINNIQFLGRVGQMNSNILSGTVPGINDVIIMGRNCLFNSNTLAGTSSVSSFSSIKLIGDSTSCSSNTISSSGTGGIIKGINLIGLASLFTNNIMNGSSTSTTGFLNINLNGTGSKINAVNFNSIASSTVQNITIDAAGAGWDTITFASNSNLIQNVHWTQDNRILWNVIRTGLTNTANNGAINSPIYVGYIPVAKAYPVTGQVTFEGSGLTGVGASLQAGIETDGDTAILPVTAITSLTGISQPTVTMTKSTVVNRRITVTPTGAALTAGGFQMMIEFRVSNF